MSNEKLILAMIEYFAKDPKRIQHFIKVYTFARVIGTKQRVDEDIMRTIEVAAIVHDIGIKPSEEIFGDCIGRHQEELGAGAAQDMLSRLGYPDELVHRVAFLVGHHHTYSNIDGLDYQILVEADFLVNIYEENMSHEAARAAYENIFN